MKKLLPVLVVAVAVITTGCASVGSHVGGPDRCMTYSYGACTLKVENGILLAGSTLDLHGRTENYVDADPHESAMRHAFMSVTDNGGILIGPRHNPAVTPLMK